MARNRWSNDDPRQGSAFHELVVLPTVAPHLARPYHVPGTVPTATNDQPLQVPQAALAEPDHVATAPTPAGEGSDTPATEIGPDALVDVHEFFVIVTVDWMERDKMTRSARPKKQSESKTTSDKLKVLRMNRAEFIAFSLSAHNLQKVYIPGPTSGPGMKVVWTGFAGGQARAPVIQDDTDWKMCKDQLREQVKRTKGKLCTVCVSFDLDSMEGFKNRKRPLDLSQEIGPVELTFGTNVPSVGAFLPDQVLLGRAIDEIKNAWACEKHGVCFVQDKTHIELNRFRLAAFGSAVVAGQCLATGAPPNELLQSWMGPQGASTSVAKIPRGRSGPGRGSSEAPPASNPNDTTTNLLLSTMVPVVTMMAHSMSESIKKKDRRGRSPPSSLPPSSPPRPSSPPPPVADELDQFLKAFATAKGISFDVIPEISQRLSAAGYDPDAISEVSLPVARVQELTLFSEGQAYSLRKFAREWCGKVQAKRAKVKH